VQAYSNELGLSFLDAARHLDLAAREASRPGLKPRPVEHGGPRAPAVFTNEHDVNSVCGHFLGNLCTLCGVCTSCDGCYCFEG